MLHWRQRCKSTRHSQLSLHPRSLAFTMPTAILSVYDKTGIIELAQALVAQGWSLLASGGTARLLLATAVQSPRSRNILARPKFWVDA